MEQEKNFIFVISGLTIKNNENTDSRAFGFYFDLNTAKERVIDNASDISEWGTFNYMVIEKTPYGVYPMIEQEYWFKWNKEEEKYDECERPKMGEFTIVNFGLG